MFDQATQDQIAHIMLKSGIPKQKIEALNYLQDTSVLGVGLKETTICVDLQLVVKKDEFSLLKPVLKTMKSRTS
jgi:hypothetical protein